MQFVMTSRGHDPACRFLLAALLGLAVGSCQQGEDALQPVLRLAEELDPRVAGQQASRCAVANQSRLSLGCARRHKIVRTTIPFPADGTIRIQGKLPARLTGGRVLLETSVMTDSVAGWKALPPVVIEGKLPGINLQMPLPESLKRLAKLRVRVLGLRVRRLAPTFQTREITIPPRSSLQVGLAFDPVSADLDTPPTVFTIEARTKSGDHQLLATTVHPNQARGGWIDENVDLSNLVGQRVRLVFKTTAAPPADGHFDPSLPLWGNPQILAERPRLGQRNIILVSLDTLRGDFVGTNFQQRNLTPTLDERARQGTSFRQALATYPSTSGSHMSLFTSTYPVRHKVLHAKHVLDPNIPTLGEIFSAHHYETAAFTENGMLAAGAGFERGFDIYFENRGLSMWDARGDIEQTLDRGLAWLENHRNEKFFLFLHTYQVHFPYEPPEEHDVFDQHPKPGENPAFSAERNSYAGEVMYTDRIIGRLFTTLEKLGLDESTIVVITSDHGEEFGEHGDSGHARTVYEEILHIPLIFWGPGLIPANQRIEGPVSLVDLAPTMLELVGLPVGPSLRGESLAAAILEGRAPSDSLRFAEGPALKDPSGRIFAARTNKYKWIAREHDPASLEIYDLAADPGEKHNLAGNPALTAQGRELLRTYALRGSEKKDPKNETSPARELDPETRRKLEALGYVDE